MVSKLVTTLCVTLLLSVSALCQSPLIGPATSGSPLNGAGSLVFGGPGPTFNTHLISGWPMNDGSGLVLRDVSGNGNNATLSAAGAVTWQSNAGFPGTTTLWNATGQGNTTSASLLNFTNTQPFSVAVWMKTTSTGPRVFVGNRTSVNNIGWDVDIIATGVNMYLINNFPSNYIQVQSTGVTVTDGVLHYIVFTYDGSSAGAGVKMYVDGSPVTTSITNNTLTGSIATGAPVVLGSLTNAVNHYLGVMGFVAVYNTVLTPTQASTYYARGPAIN